MEAIFAIGIIIYAVYILKRSLDSISNKKADEQKKMQSIQLNEKVSSSDSVKKLTQLADFFKNHIYTLTVEKTYIKICTYFENPSDIENSGLYIIEYRYADIQPFSNDKECEIAVKCISDSLGGKMEVCSHNSKQLRLKPPENS